MEEGWSEEVMMTSNQKCTVNETCCARPKYPVKDYLYGAHIYDVINQSHVIQCVCDVTDQSIHVDDHGSGSAKHTGVLLQQAIYLETEILLLIQQLKVIQQRKFLYVDSTN